MSRLDERAARQTEDQARRRFSDAGKTAGQDFSKALSAGLSDSDAAVRKSAENAEKAYKKAADSAGHARVEEAKLDDLRSRGAGATALLTQTEKLEKAKRADETATRTAVTAMRDLDTAQTAAVRSGGVLSNLLSGLASGASGSRLGGMATQAGDLSSKLGGISPVALGATAGIAALAVGVGVAGKALYDLGAAWDAVGDNITGHTGIMGEQLKGITDSIKQIGSQSAISFGDIGNLAGGVAQSLHLSGDAATAMTQKLADIQQVTQQVVNTKDLGKAFRLFDITDAQAEIDTLGQLTAASQSANVPINDLLTTLSNTGKASKEAGLGLQETLGVLLTLEDAGVSFEKAGPSLSIFLKNAAKDGRDANQVLAEGVKQIKAFIDAGNDPAANQLAVKMFGGRGYLDFFDAIKDGKLDVENLTDALKKLGDTKNLIDDEKKSTEDWSEGWEKLKHKFQSFVEPVADFLFSNVNQPLLQIDQTTNQVTASVDRLGTSLNSLNPDKLAAAMGLPGMPGGPTAPAGPGLPTTKPGTPTTGLGPNFYKDWYKTPEELKRDQASAAKLPDAPVLPYDQSLPQGFAGVPQTSAIVSAENSWMDARHTVAEKQARLNQLEGDNNAKAADIQKARNDVINAQQAQNQAELSLYDARQSLYDKENKALKDHTDALGEFGAKLDQDFGISKGLPGIAENLTKFLGNLIAAPFLSQMDAVANAPGQAQGGFGLIGMLGAQGAFGPQYTAAGQAAAAGDSSASGKSTAVLGPGGQVGMTSPGTAMPGESARDFAHRVMMPFWQNQGFQVGDHGADQFGEHQHGAVDVMVPNLSAGSQVLQQALSDPNVYGAIFNNQTYGYGHGTTPQDYSGGHTGDPNQDHQNHVHIWYKPGDSGDITPTGAGPFGPMGATSGLGPSSAGGGGVVPVFVTNMGGGGMSSGGGGGSAPSGSPASGQGAGMPPGPGGGQQWLAQQLTAAGLSPDQAKGILAMNQVEGGATNPSSLLGFTDAQAQGPQGHLQAFMKQWNDPSRRGAGGSIPGVGPNGQVSDWDSYMNWIRQKIVGQNGAPGQPAPGDYQQRLMDALGQQSGGLGMPTTAPTAGQGFPLPTSPIDFQFGPQPAGGTGFDPNLLLGGTAPGQEVGTPLFNFGRGAGGAGPGVGGAGGQPGAYGSPGVGAGGQPPGAPGAPGGTGVGGAGAASAATQIGGGPGLSGTGKGGIGMQEGGALDTAMGLAASAVPGLGQAAQTGMKLANRAIQFGGQAAGILTQGALDTWLPFGGSELASHNWLTRIVGGLAGAAPALPNMAGKKASAPKDQIGQGQDGQGGPGGPPPINVTYNNHQATEDRAGADLTTHLAAMYASGINR